MQVVEQQLRELLGMIKPRFCNRICSESLKGNIDKCLGLFFDLIILEYYKVKKCSQMLSYEVFQVRNKFLFQNWVKI
jgi:hypothetical protein